MVGLMRNSFEESWQEAGVHLSVENGENHGEPVDGWCPK
jgi:hypothetical protein